MSEDSRWAPLGRPFRAPTGSSHNPAGKVPGIASSAQRSRRSMLGAPMRSPAFFFLQVVQDGPTNFLKLFIFFLICRLTVYIRVIKFIHALSDISRRRLVLGFFGGFALFV